MGMDFADAFVETKLFVLELFSTSMYGKLQRRNPEAYEHILGAFQPVPHLRFGLRLVVFCMPLVLEQMKSNAT